MSRNIHLVHWWRLLVMVILGIFSFECLHVHGDAAVNTNDEPLKENLDDAATIEAASEFKGPLYLPCDAIFDIRCREALAALKQEAQTDENENESNENSLSREQALRRLAPGGNSDMAVLTFVGYKGGKLADQINQDRVLIQSPFDVPPKNSETANMNSLLAVFDGHGSRGHQVSQFVREVMPQALATALREGPKEEKEQPEDSSASTGMTRLLEKVVEDVDSSIPEKDGLKGGSTATMILRLEDTLYFINTGDSQSFVAGYYDDGMAGSDDDTEKNQIPDTRVLFETRLDKPELPEERARIEAAGGHVMPRSKDDDPRAWSSTYTYGLAMSRSLGDHTNEGVIATPIVTPWTIRELQELYVERVRQQHTEECETEVIVNADGTTTDSTTTKSSCLNDEEKIKRMSPEHVQLFVVCASDGILDYVETDEVAYAVNRAFSAQSDDSEHYHLLQALDSIIHTSAQLWYEKYNGRYRDDMAIAAMRIKHR